MGVNYLIFLFTAVLQYTTSTVFCIAYRIVYEIQVYHENVPDYSLSFLATFDTLDSLTFARCAFISGLYFPTQFPSRDESCKKILFIILLCTYQRTYQHVLWKSLLFLPGHRGSLSL